MTVVMNALGVLGLNSSHVELLAVCPCVNGERAGTRDHALVGEDGNCKSAAR
jgi:hypothetical protein